MQAAGRFTLGKEERIAGRSLVETLFKGGGSRSMSYYPLRIVYCLVAQEKSPVRILVSVPKRCFKRAVKRNRVKRQVREAYRLNKHLLDERMVTLSGQSLALAFVWLDDHLRESKEVEQKVRTLLVRLSEKL